MQIHFDRPCCYAAFAVALNLRRPKNQAAILAPAVRDELFKQMLVFSGFA
jgi:hypothetical protein